MTNYPEGISQLNTIRQFSSLDFIESLSAAMDSISPDISHHHHQVAYISYRIAKELGFSEKELDHLFTAALLHDCGALSMPGGLLPLLNFELEDIKVSSLKRHAEAGYLLLRKFGPFDIVSRIIRLHHHPWQDIADNFPNRIALSSNIIHLADRFDVLLKGRNDIFDKPDLILEYIGKMGDTIFNPELIEILGGLTQSESFREDISNIPMLQSLGAYLNIEDQIYDCDRLLEMTEVFSHIIDFRCSFTASHNSCVSTLSGALGRLAGLAEEECIMLKIAGNLHDLGKLAVPVEIINKPDRLTCHEYSIIQTHSYYTHKILSKFRNLDSICKWASYHHERIDGKGYPFKLSGEELDLGSRIVAVADVYTALTEDRPYRDGMSEKEAIMVMSEMSGTVLDGDVVNLLIENLPDLSMIIDITATEIKQSYKDFRLLMGG